MNDLRNATGKLHTLVEVLSANSIFELRAEVHLIGNEAPEEQPRFLVEFTGSDTSLLTADNGSLLYAIEHLAIDLLRLGPDEHHRISVDAAHFKAKRERDLNEMVHAAINAVRSTAAPHIFPPMAPRERRLLHLALLRSGLQSASIGQRPQRRVVLYPQGVVPPVQRDGPPGRPSAV